MALKVKKKAKSSFDKFTNFISGFLGSWWAVFFHSFWFTVWLILAFDLNVLTFAVSLEAIFIGIFLLMAANKAEVARDAKESREREKDREKIERDLKLDEKADRQLTEIKRSFKDLEKRTKTIEGLLRKFEK